MAQRPAPPPMRASGKEGLPFIEDGACPECEKNKHRLREVHDHFKKIGLHTNSAGKSYENSSKDFQALFKEIIKSCYLLVEERKKGSSNTTTELLECLNENTALRQTIGRLEEQISELDHENNELKQNGKISEFLNSLPSLTPGANTVIDGKTQSFDLLRHELLLTQQKLRQAQEQLSKTDESFHLIQQQNLRNLQTETLDPSTIPDLSARYWETLADGLDFKKYEEIINYIQTWAKNLKEPKAIENTTSTVLDKIELDFDSPYSADEMAFLDINKDTCVEQIVKSCNQALQAALENKLIDLVVLVKQTLSTRRHLLKEDLERAESYLESTESYYGSPSLSRLGQPTIEMTLKSLREYIQNLRDRLDWLDKLRPENTLCGREGLLGRRVTFSS